MSGCCYSRPVPPPDPRLVGTWVLNQQSTLANFGFGHYRYSKIKGIFRFLTPICRLRINPQGWISYAQTKSPNQYVVIDGPVTQWQENKIKCFCNTQIKLDYSRINQSILNVNGHILHRI